MNVRILTLLSTLTAASVLTACGGGAGGAATGSLPPSGGGTGQQSNRSLIEQSIGAANSIGTPLKAYSDYNEATNSPAQARLRQGMSLTANGQCVNGVEFFAPDKNGDANSTERIYFYDSGCTQIAKDDVRLYSSTSSSSETVHRTVTLYASGNSSPEAVRSETINFTNASFDQYGYPIAASGFDRTSTGNLNLSGVKTIDGDSELAVSAANGNTETFCGDSAGFNATGNQQLGETFGWAGIASSGTRTANSDGSTTWSATHTGSIYTGPIGSLSIGIGGQNTTCPITTPMFTLTGGTAKGSYSLPISATFASGMLSNLTITNATLANGNTLNVQTNQGVSPTAAGFISGTIANSSGTQISTFTANAFGDGTLSVVATGNTYSIVDWHVVK